MFNFVIKSLNFETTIEFCNKAVTFSNKKPDAFRYKIFLHFVTKWLFHLVII